MLFFALGDAKVPDARYFAFWWNIGFILRFHTSSTPVTRRSTTIKGNRSSERFVYVTRTQKVKGHDVSYSKSSVFTSKCPQYLQKGLGLFLNTDAIYNLVQRVGAGSGSFEISSRVTTFVNFHCRMTLFQNYSSIIYAV